MVQGVGRRFGAAACEANDDWHILNSALRPSGRRTFHKIRDMISQIRCFALLVVLTTFVWALVCCRCSYHGSWLADCSAILNTRLVFKQRFLRLGPKAFGVDSGFSEVVVRDQTLRAVITCRWQNPLHGEVQQLDGAADAGGRFPFLRTRICGEVVCGFHENEDSFCQW